MVELGFEDLAKYPILKEVEAYFRERKISLEELSLDDYRPVLERARERIFEAVERAKVSYKRGCPDLEIMSFLVAFLLVRASGSEFLMQKYSLSEARRIEELLQGEKSDGVFSYVVKALGIDAVALEDGTFELDFDRYLRLATRLHSDRWKLVNRELSKGSVRIPRRDLVRLVREAVRDLIYERLRKAPAPKVPESVKGIVEELKSISPKPVRRPKAKGGAYPPCVSHALEMLSKGENVPHIGRFLLVSYLYNKGVGIEDIISLFSTSPDFNERITRYQVEHIAGIRGGGKKYLPPSCRILQSKGFCFKTEECNGIKNPLQFRGRKVERG